MKSTDIVIIPSWYSTERDTVAGIFIRQQARALQKAGLNISILFVEETLRPGSDQFSLTEDNGLNIYRLKAFSFPKRMEWSLMFWYKKWERLLAGYYRKNGFYPQLIHAHSFVGGAAARHLGRKYNLPYVITEHYQGFISGKIPGHWKKKLSNIYGDAQAVIAVSNTLKKGLAPFTSAVKVIPNIIDPDIFYSPTESRLPSAVKRVVSIGSLVPRKAHADLLEIFSSVSQQIPAELVIIGDGPLRKKLEDLSRSLRISHVVHFTGNLSPERVGEELRSADLFVAASRSESFALAPVEALACGVPVVMMRCGSVLEEMDLESVSIVDSKAELEEEIVKKLTDKDFPAPLPQTINELFGPEIITVQLKMVYEEAASTGFR